MGKLILSTKKSLFPAPEVEIDGVTYQARPLSDQFFDEFGKLKESGKGKEGRGLLIDQVRIIYDIDISILKKLDLRDVTEIIKDAVKQIKESQELKEGEQKNGLKPEETG